jgi:hypothetical protein
MSQEAIHTVYFHCQPLPPIKEFWFFKEPSKRTYYKASKKKRGKNSAGST